MFSTEPRRALRCGHAARVKRTAPINFSANPSTQSASVNSKKSPRFVAPALFTTMSMALEAPSARLHQRSRNRGIAEVARDSRRHCRPRI